MRKNSAAYRLGLTCIALCLLLRFHGTLEAVLAAPETGEFLLYLETGRRAVRSGQTKTAVPAYAPESPAVAGALPPEALPHIFDAFYRADPARNEKITGSGLGLAIVSRAVRNMKGRIIARNVQPHGLLLEIQLPKLETEG